MRTFVRSEMNTFVAVAIGALLTAFGASQGWAQGKHTISFKTPAANTKYTEQHVMDVGDVPGHKIRIYEIHRTYPTNPPVYEGARVVEEWVHGYSDYIDINGRAWGYGISVLENGDKIFAEYDGLSQTTATSDGSIRSTSTGVTRLTGGTGKFRGIRGLLRYMVIFNPTTGLNEQQTEGEYSLE